MLGSVRRTSDIAGGILAVFAEWVVRKRTPRNAAVKVAVRPAFDEYGDVGPHGGPSADLPCPALLLTSL